MKYVVSFGIITAIAVGGCSPSNGSETSRTSTGSGQPTSAAPSAATPATGLVAKRVWTTARISTSGPSGDVNVKPDSGHVLMLLDLTVAGDQPVSVHLDQLEARGSTNVAPVGVAPLSSSDFAAFSELAPGWRTLVDANHREIKIGRDKQDQPIELTVAPGATISIAYIVPQGGPPFSVTLPGMAAVKLVPGTPC